MENKITWKKINDGARYRWTVRFPNTKIQLGEEGELITCTITFDNSYDKSTGARNTLAGVYRGIRIPANKTFFNTYYARHTNSMDMTEAQKVIQSNLEGYIKEVSKKWQKYYETQINQQNLINELNFLIDKKEEKKKIPVSKKYLKGFMSFLIKNDYNNIWDVYTMFCDVLTAEKASIDVYDRVAEYMENWLQKNYQTISR